MLPLCLLPFDWIHLPVFAQCKYVIVIPGYSSRLGLSHWDPYAMHRGGCLELYYCNMVESCWWDSSLSARPTGFLQCFDTVGLFIWPLKIVPNMTYNMFGGTLNLAQSILVTLVVFCGIETKVGCIKCCSIISWLLWLGDKMSEHRNNEGAIVYCTQRLLKNDETDTEWTINFF